MKFQNDSPRKIIVTTECIGSGICATIAPEIFEMDAEDRKSKLRSDADLTNLKKAHEAAEACPVAAIKIEE